jgi:hypothetical protein
MWVRQAERVLVANTVLHDHESRVRVCHGLEDRRDGRRVDGFVGADDVVEGVWCFGWGAIDCDVA